MIKKYNILSMIIALFLVCLLPLTIGIGCKTAATGEEEAAAAEEEAVVVEEEPAVEETSTEEVAEGEVKNIVVWLLWFDTEPQATIFNYWKDEFEKTHPDINIQLNFKGRTVLTDAAVALEAGETIDIFDIDISTIGNLISDKIVAPLDSYLDQPSLEDPDKTWRETFIPGVLEVTADTDGQIYIIPYSLRSNAFMHDKKLWNDNGWQEPTTWDELIDFCETVKASGIAPIAQETVSIYMDIWFYNIMQRLKGGEFIIQATEDTTGEMWMDPAVKEAIEMEQFITQYCQDDWRGMTWPAGQTALANREAAFEMTGTWIPIELTELVAEDFEWGLTPFVDIPGGVGKRTDMECYTISLGINADSAYIDEAAEWLKFCTTIPMMDYSVDLGWEGPTVLGAKFHPTKIDYSEKLLNATSWYKPHGGIPAYYPDYYMNVYLKNHDLAFKSEITPDEFCEAMKQDTIDYWANK